MSGPVLVQFTLNQGMLIGILLSGLLGWWLFSGPGLSMFYEFKGWCPDGCQQPPEYCCCRPDLDQRVECDDGTEHFLGGPDPAAAVEVVFEPDGEWEFVAWEDLTEDERREIDGEG